MEYDEGLTLLLGLGLVDARADILGLKDENEDALSGLGELGIGGGRLDRPPELNDHDDDGSVGLLAVGAGGGRDGEALGLKVEKDDGFAGLVFPGPEGGRDGRPLGEENEDGFDVEWGLVVGLDGRALGLKEENDDGLAGLLVFGLAGARARRSCGLPENEDGFSVESVEVYFEASLLENPNLIPNGLGNCFFGESFVTSLSSLEGGAVLGLVSESFGVVGGSTFRFAQNGGLGKPPLFEDGFCDEVFAFFGDEGGVWCSSSGCPEEDSSSDCVPSISLPSPSDSSSSEVSYSCGSIFSSCLSRSYCARCSSSLSISYAADRRAKML
jgi:hypothetical protein